MQIHYKSLFLGMAVGTILVLAVLFLVLMSKQKSLFLQVSRQNASKKNWMSRLIKQCRMEKRLPK